MAMHKERCLGGVQCICNIQGRNILSKLRAMNLSTRTRSSDVKEVDEIRSLTAAAQNELRQYSKRIAELYSLAYSLENEQDEMRNHLISCKSLLSPIRRIPAGVLARIMHHSDPQIEVVRGFVMCNRTLANLRSVCRYWRDIADITPSLWQKILILSRNLASIRQNTIMETSPFTASDVLSRSGNTGLIVEINSGFGTLDWDDGHVKAFMVSLMSSANRLVSLHLRCLAEDDPGLMSYFRDSSTLPRLQEVYIVGTALRAPSHFNSYAFLTTLGLTTGPQYATHIRPLRECSQIRNLTLFLRYVPNRQGRADSILATQSANTIGSPIVLETLASLDLRIQTSHVNWNHVLSRITQAILASLQCPHLKFLDVTYAPRDDVHRLSSAFKFPVNDLIDFFRRRETPLSLLKLQFQNICFAGIDLVNLLQVDMPLLRTLKIRNSVQLEDSGSDSESMDSDVLLRHLAGWKRSNVGGAQIRPLRALQNLHLQLDGGFEDALFLKMVKSRWTGMDGKKETVSSLRKLTLHVTNRVLDKALYAPLAHLMRDGLIVELRDQAGWVDFGEL